MSEIGYQSSRGMVGNVRVLLISPLPPPEGGIARWTKILLAKINKFPDITLRHIDTAVRWKKIENRSQILKIVGGSIQAIRDFLRVFLGIVSFRPHVLHLTSSGGYAAWKDALIMLGAKILGVPGVIHYRTSRIVGDGLSRRWQFHAACLGMRLASMVVVLDSETFQFLKHQIPNLNLRKIPNMIDLEKIDWFSSQVKNSELLKPVRKREKVRLIFVGLVVPEKGIGEQIEVCCHLPNVELHIVGQVDEKYQKQLEFIAHGRDGGVWLYFHGSLDNREAINQILLSDILLLPSRKVYEAFPNVLLEAMALGKPAVVSQVGAMAEMIDADGEYPCGVCVKPGDAQSLFIGLKGFLSEPERWPQVGQRGRARVERLYSTKSVMSQLVHQWKEVAWLHGHRGRIKEYMWD